MICVRIRIGCWGRRHPVLGVRVFWILGWPLALSGGWRAVASVRISLGDGGRRHPGQKECEAGGGDHAGAPGAARTLNT